MSKKRRRRDSKRKGERSPKAWVTGIVSWGVLLFVIARLAASDGKPVSVIEQGRIVYEENCAICHGILGDGRGMAEMMLRTKPRDFRQGIFKFRSTPTGSLPTDEDLFHTISKGLRGTGMIAQDRLSEAERRAVVEYLKTFAGRFQKEVARRAVPVPKPPDRTPSLLAEGRRLYEEAGCPACHGIEGKGDGPSAAELKDFWGYPIQPSDLTRPLKRGSTAEDIFKTLATGLDGTPMPSYEASLSGEELWALSHYVSSLDTGILSRPQSQEEAAGEMVVRMHGRGGMMRQMPMMR